MLSKRDFVLGSITCASFQVSSKASALSGDADYKEYPFVDYFDKNSGVSFGPTVAPAEDTEIATQLADEMPKDSPYSIMKALSEISRVGSSGEIFNTRWKS